jgi:hypothetical protein
MTIYDYALLALFPIASAVLAAAVLWPIRPGNAGTRTDKDR